MVEEVHSKAEVTNPGLTGGLSTVYPGMVKSHYWFDSLQR